MAVQWNIQFIIIYYLHWLLDSLTSATPVYASQRASKRLFKLQPGRQRWRERCELSTPLYIYIIYHDMGNRRTRSWWPLYEGRENWYTNDLSRIKEKNKIKKGVTIKVVSDELFGRITGRGGDKEPAENVWGSGHSRKLEMFGPARKPEQRHCEDMGIPTCTLASNPVARYLRSGLRAKEEYTGKNWAFRMCTKTTRKYFGLVGSHCLFNEAICKSGRQDMTVRGLG
jgi:hypothetical protein